MLIIGHRGTAGTASENTLASFEKAIRAGVQMVELDVHLCATGELVVIHDEKVNRTTNGKGAVARMSLAQLQQLDAGQGEKIPTLRQVLQHINRRAKVNIELKGKEVAAPVFGLLEEFKSRGGWKTGDFCISSFDHAQLLQYRQMDNATPIGILYSRHPRRFASLAQRLHASSINIPMAAAKADTIRKIHAENLEVWVYTVNEIADALHLKNLGVDAIFTNFPEKMAALA